MTNSCNIHFFFSVVKIVVVETHVAVAAAGSVGVG